MVYLLFCYFDDLWAIVVYKSSDITTKFLVKDLLQHLQHHTYHPTMKLILEEVSNNTFNFLEEKISIDQGSLSCQWHSKNFQSLLELGKLKFITNQEIFSYSEKENYSSCNYFWEISHFWVTRLLTLTLFKDLVF